MADSQSLLDRLKALFSKQEGLEDLLRASESYDGYKRENALRRLGVLGNPIALPEVLERINDWVPQVREAARDALRRLATPVNAKAYVECLPVLYRLRGRWRDNHAGTISFVEQFLCSSENSKEIISGIASKDRSVSKYCALLSIEHGLMPKEGLVELGLSHTDVSVRLKAAALISELPKLSQDHAFGLALRNTFMPVRRIAILNSIRAGISEGEACRYLFDRHPSVRSLIVSEFGTWVQPPLAAYRLKLSSSVRREQRIAVWGVGEYGKPKDAETLTPFLDNKDILLRKQALASYSKLLKDDARSIVIGALKDTQLATEAARICVRQRLKPLASELADVLRECESDQSIAVCLSAIEKSGKWERLIFILDALIVGSERPRLLEVLGKWEQTFNVSHSQPTKEQTEAIKNLLSASDLTLSEQMGRKLAFTLRPFGMVARAANHSLQA